MERQELADRIREIDPEVAKLALLSLVENMKGDWNASGVTTWIGIQTRGEL